jgi:peroxiredoxin
LNYTPFKLNEFAEAHEGVSSATQSAFLKRHFGDHKGYQRACASRTELVAKMIILNQDTQAMGERELLVDPEDH